MKQLDLTKPVQTRDGRPVRILCTDARGNYPVIGIYVQEEGVNERPSSWTLDGENYTDTKEARLINVPIKRRVTGWLNVYPKEIWGPHTTKNEADLGSRADRIACIHIDIEYTEGDGLEGAE